MLWSVARKRWPSHYITNAVNAARISRSGEHTSMVPGEGPRNAKLMIVGEAPSYHEVREGRPFVGDAGQELDKLLRSANIHRPDCYITNACQEQVRGDKASFFFAGGKP